MANKNTVQAFLSFALDGNTNRIQLLPAQDFRSIDGRLLDAPMWRINKDIAASLISKAANYQKSIPIDYGHQTQLANSNGKPAPAAGWFKQLQWIEGQGLFAVAVQWTETARQHIKNGEYRYISPVMSYNKETGEIIEIIMAGLVNTPAIDGMESVTALAQNQHVQTVTLSQDELNVCALMGINQQDFAKTKSKQSTTAPESSNPNLSQVELDVCRAMGLSPDKFKAEKLKV